MSSLARVASFQAFTPVRFSGVQPGAGVQNQEKTARDSAPSKADPAKAPVNRLALGAIGIYRYLKHDFMGGAIRKSGITGRCQHAKEGCNNCSSLGLDAFKKLPALQATLVTSRYIFTCFDEKRAQDSKLYGFVSRAMKPVAALIAFLHQVIYQQPIEDIVEQLNDAWRVSGKPALEATA